MELNFLIEIMHLYLHAFSCEQKGNFMFGLNKKKIEK